MVGVGPQPYSEEIEIKKERKTIKMNGNSYKETEWIGDSKRKRQRDIEERGSASDIKIRIQRNK